MVLECFLRAQFGGRKTKDRTGLAEGWGWRETGHPDPEGSVNMLYSPEQPLDFYRPLF